MIETKKVIYALILCAVVAFMALNAREVNANGAPIKVILTYLPSMSNWGPTDATGVAEVTMKEGEVDISVVGLPSLTDESYSGWIINTRDDKALSFGRFNTDGTKTAKVRAILPAEIPDSGWNLVLITVEPKAKGSSAPGELRSIGGYFPDASGTGASPSRLPSTGGDSTANASSPSPSGFTTINVATDDKADTADDWFTYAIGFGAVLGLAVMTRKSLRRQ